MRLRLVTRTLSAIPRSRFYSKSTPLCNNVNMIETKHLATGSTCPSLGKGVLRVYNMRFCPYAQRVLLVLDTKKVPYEMVNVDLVDKPEWLFEKSPMGKVPALEKDGDILYESLIISDYLDEKYPQVPLYPKDPLLKAKEKLLIDGFARVITNMFGMILNPDKLNAEHFEKTMASIDVYEKELTKRNEPYFGGKSPNMVDLMIWPWFERIELLSHLGGNGYILPGARFVKLMDWAERMKSHEGVKVQYLTPEIHAKFLASRMSGRTNYNLLVASNL